MSIIESFMLGLALGAICVGLIFVFVIDYLAKHEDESSI